ncbi:hypothetical protein LTR28_004823 [Elasticomyces elasticus]|nr:hypothetical protein LTR28_004823 [Elasticomyces elasticus]
MRDEIQSLREAIMEEKKKEGERGKAIGLLEKGEKPGQPLFSSHSKLTRRRWNVNASKLYRVESFRQLEREQKKRVRWKRGRQRVLWHVRQQKQSKAAKELNKQ